MSREEQIPVILVGLRVISVLKGHLETYNKPFFPEKVELGWPDRYRQFE